MKIKILFLLLFLAATQLSKAQSEEVQKLVQEGIALYDAGDYKGAISKYKKALKKEPENPTVNYEIALTYSAIKDYDKAIEFVDKLIEMKPSYKYIDEAYGLKGSAQDNSGKPKEAIISYRKAIEINPKSYLHHYNLALTLKNEKEYKECETELQKAVKIKPTHPSSHLMLSNLKRDQGYRIQSMLAAYKFLLLEPNTKRSIDILKILERQFTQGVEKVNKDSINISVSIIDTTNQFGQAELMLSLMSSLNLIEGGKLTPQNFAKNTKSLFKTLSELKKDQKGFWWDTYVEYFYEIVHNEHDEAFSYYILQSKDDPVIDTWLKKNTKKVKSFADWYQHH
jgi:tetratricopeptide (TPR) repeat protein